ncbi:hypothetical protein [Actinomadura atramentaria]|uniref:hypothetical protein n=1 Tax=Actinomadura atramentaria TaxID=1990 RepID=UPI00037CE917|nr:hypothetical protein [Actinomadura atramentaria]
MLHSEPHPNAGQTVTIAATGDSYVIEDWWDRVGGQSWMSSGGTIACLDYAIHSFNAGLPLDDEVVYGKTDGLGYLHHVSELDLATSNDTSQGAQAA